MPTLIKHAQVFAPQALGVRDVLLSGARIAALGEKLDISGRELETVEADGRWLLPGLVDPLTHPCGGGGEGGFGNRTSELEAPAFIEGGVTTLVGALGTDSITRSLEVLYGQVMKLRAAGLAAYMYSGSYRVPATTLTGDLARDMLMVEPVIGAGELAIADHRASHPSLEEIRRIASDIHLGGTLSGKGGTLFLHVGDGSSGLDLVEATLCQSDLPRRLFYPTHCNRKAALLEQAIGFAQRGGYADLTVSSTPELLAAGEVSALEAFREAIEAGAPASRFSFSSDAGGSLPHYENGQLIGLQEAKPSALLDLLRRAIGDGPAAPVEVIAALTRNPADALKLWRKGRIEPGADADLLLLDPAENQLTDVFCHGRRLMSDRQITVNSRHA
ncbi:MAG: beta-aspartyl-peptidase [Xanthomonadales bacterium]|jgi:beta-aspartyl-dipeptidase (metallo-type)|nr:beta-aspartyl-peptidase [Xanthomonadales bacterium]